jgi:hypothetical protein
VARKCAPVLVNGMVSSVLAPPCQMIRSPAVLVAGSTVTTTSARIARNNCLRSRNVVEGAVNTARTSAPARDSQACSCSVSRTGRRGSRGQQVSFGLPLRSQFRLQGAFQGAGNEPVLRLDRVVLASGPVGFIAGPFGGQLEGTHCGGLGPFGVGQRLRGRGQRRRLENGEHLLEDPVLQPASAQALAAFLTAIE